MANYIVSYDLMKRKDYAAVEAAIARVDHQALRLLETVWYLQSPRAAHQIYDAIVSAMDADDKLLVVEAVGAVSDEARAGPVWGRAVQRWRSTPAPMDFL